MCVIRLAVVIGFVLAVAGCGSHGPRAVVGNYEVYYLDGATKEQAEILAGYYARQPNAKGGVIQLKKAGARYQFRVSALPEVQRDPNTLAIFELDAARIARDALGGAALDVHVCDDGFNTVQSSAGRADLRYGIDINKVEVFYSAPDDKAIAEKLARSFIEDFDARNGATVKFARAGKTAQVHMVYPGMHDAGALAFLKRDANVLSKKLFDGGPVELHLCDSLLRSVKVVSQ